MGESFIPDIAIPVATRTLLAAGFAIEEFQRQPTHVEYDCTRLDTFGIDVRYVIAIFGASGPKDEQLTRLRKAAADRSRVLAVVAEAGGDGWLSWDDFLESLGGAVPTWRALGEEYEEMLRISSKNELPAGLTGEPWRIFEEAVADGLEFVFGRRVLRLGSRRRGQRVGDQITQTPDEQVLLIDAKASRGAYEVSMPGLRPLKEYVDLQRGRQRGQFPLAGAVVVAREFAQEEEALNDVAREFLSEAKVPISFLGIDLLLQMVAELKPDPRIRNAIAWRRVFTRGGLVPGTVFADELRGAKEQRYERSKPVRP